jgi:hypothetical protein
MIKRFRLSYVLFVPYVAKQFSGLSGIGVVMRKLWFFVLALALVAPALARAEHPFLVESTDVQGKGNYRYELDADYMKSDAILHSSDITNAFIMGVGKHSDMEIDLPYRMLRPSPFTDRYAQGPGDMQLKIKQRTYENEVHQSVAYQMYVDFPTGAADNALGRDNLIFGFQLMDQQGCCDTIYRASIGFETYTKNIARWNFASYRSLRYGLSIDHALGSAAHFLAELAGENRTENDRVSGNRLEIDPFTAMSGLRYDFSKTWYADLAIRAGLNTDAERYSLLSGVAWRF